MLNDVGKLVVLCLTLVGGFSLIIIGEITHDPTLATVGVGFVGPVVGYVTGNGVLAARGKAPSPVLVPKLRQDTQWGDSVEAAAEAGPTPVDPTGADPEAAS